MSNLARGPLTMRTLPPQIVAAGDSLCRCVLGGHLELPDAQGKFVGLVIRAGRVLDEAYDLDDAAAGFVYRLNDLATDIDATRAVIRAYAAKAIAAGLPPADILSKALEEARGHLTAPEVREILRDEWRRRVPLGE